jgi:hypothetical protein
MSELHDWRHISDIMTVCHLDGIPLSEFRINVARGRGNGLRVIAGTFDAHGIHYHSRTDAGLPTGPPQRPGIRRSSLTQPKPAISSLVPPKTPARMSSPGTYKRNGPCVTAGAVGPWGLTHGGVRKQITTSPEAAE